MSTHAKTTHTYKFVCFEKLYRAIISSVEERLPYSSQQYDFEQFNGLIYITIGIEIFINLWIYICRVIEYS